MKNRPDFLHNDVYILLCIFIFIRGESDTGGANRTPKKFRLKSILKSQLRNANIAGNFASLITFIDFSFCEKDTVYEHRAHVVMLKQDSQAHLSQIVHFNQSSSVEIHGASHTEQKVEVEEHAIGS